MGCKGKRRIEWPFTRLGKTEEAPDWQRGHIPIRLSDEAVGYRTLYYGGHVEAVKSEYSQFIDGI